MYFFWRVLIEGFLWGALLEITFVEPFLVVKLMRSSFHPKYQPKILRISALPSNKLPGQKSLKFLVGILGEMMKS